MEITLTIPDEIAQAMVREEEPSRAVLELAGLDAWREGRLSALQLMNLLGMQSRWELWDFLKQRTPFEGEDTADSVERDLANLRSMQSPDPGRHAA